MAQPVARMPSVVLDRPDPRVLAEWRRSEAAQEKALALGARPLDVNHPNGKRDFRVYADPAGHPFCRCRIEHV
ncbi:VOC family protein [Streptomyces chiangmaiensis]|uniref:VOC family protein n=1 Tax=Streptomyces chiangmaiensis TaxID=766497 RepID=A0ABU7FGN4_9ACTN|nr:VOC family protein [Streptomyces chiangmaiensis]MED7823013.1 VOC family protein [Streptomyces chiangmaiensis]